METTSPFASQLGTNYAATTEEAAELTVFLAGPISKLADLQDEIDRAKAHYDELVERHAELANEISRHQALMAPIRRLPVDVIREIFINCLPTTHNAVISPEECPILLTRICSGWRNIALSTAVLWASIHVPIPNDVDSSPMGYGASPSKQYELAITTAHCRAEAISEWFNRSGECVLSVSLHNQQHETSAVIYNIILDALIPFCRRWGALKCDAPTPMLMRIADIPASDLPQLHTLSINGGTFENNVLLADEPQRTVWGWMDSGVVRAPRLRTIAYYNVTENFARFPLRWGQVTSISVHGGGWFASETMSLQSLVGLLATCPLLHDCHLYIPPDSRFPEDRVDGMPTSILLPRLQEFAIKSDHTYLSPLLDLLDVPMLSKLEVSTGLSIAAPLHALIRRTAYTLRSLSLTPHVFMREEFFACLQTCADLTELTLCSDFYEGYRIPRSLSLTQTQHLNGTDGDTALPDEAVMYTPLVLDDAFLLDLLAPMPNAGPIILPRLTIFTCHMFGTFSDIGVVDAICARRAAAALGKVAALRQVHIDFGRPQGQSIAHAINGLEEEGVKCTLSYTTPFPSRRSTAADGIFEFLRPWWQEPIF